jgi:hypothetical protein
MLFWICPKYFEEGFNFYPSPGAGAGKKFPEKEKGQYF